MSGDTAVYGETGRRNYCVGDQKNEIITGSPQATGPSQHAIFWLSVGDNMDKTREYLMHSIAFSFQVHQIMQTFDEPVRHLMRLRSNGVSYREVSLDLRERLDSKMFTQAWCRRQEGKVLQQLERRLLPPQRPDTAM